MINPHQTEIIKEYLRTEQFTDQALIDDLLDHISCEIELQMEVGTNFEDAFHTALEKVLPQEPVQVQQDLEFLTTKTQNIMIKKTAYVGGYVSALVFCLAVLLAVLSFQNNALVDSRRESLTDQYLTVNIDDISSEQRNEIYQDYYKETSALKLKSIQQATISQTLLIISILLFGITYLPYWFYIGFHRSELQHG
ncbi:hypothetical protein [Roseivirga sp. E12]|uniref:hypothetical protein n=1 Tax=Roseivirga sp. E12 TaxID=2819237 RepID=UPI001ABC5490|nr:hypothetical protein [Roseivirga sp. E12]MBO3700356.1 hypothetical protein [Roseivirga sp. E12]